MPKTINGHAVDDCLPFAGAEPTLQGEAEAWNAAVGPMAPAGLLGMPGVTDKPPTAEAIGQVEMVVARASATHISLSFGTATGSLELGSAVLLASALLGAVCSAFPAEAG